MALFSAVALCGMPLLLMRHSATAERNHSAPTTSTRCVCACWVGFASLPHLPSPPCGYAHCVAALLAVLAFRRFAAAACWVGFASFPHSPSASSRLQRTGSGFALLPVLDNALRARATPESTPKLPKPNLSPLRFEKFDSGPGFVAGASLLDFGVARAQCSGAPKPKPAKLACGSQIGGFWFGSRGALHPQPLDAPPCLGFASQIGGLAPGRLPQRQNPLAFSTVCLLFGSRGDACVLGRRYSSGKRYTPRYSFE